MNHSKLTTLPTPRLEAMVTAITGRLGPEITMLNAAAAELLRRKTRQRNLQMRLGPPMRVAKTGLRPRRSVAAAPAAHYLEFLQ